MYSNDNSYLESFVTILNKDMDTLKDIRDQNEYLIRVRSSPKKSLEGVLFETEKEYKDLIFLINEKLLDNNNIIKQTTLVWDTNSSMQLSKCDLLKHNILKLGRKIGLLSQRILKKLLMI